MKTQEIFLAGRLSEHVRGKLLTVAVGAQAIGSVPITGGVCIVFGEEFQEFDDSEKTKWFNWSVQSGNCLLLVPPFDTGDPEFVPIKWQIHRRSEKAKGNPNPLAALLSEQVEFEISGQLQYPGRLGGLWKDDTACTGFFRKHPASGIFCITCLPIWSMEVLNRKDLLRDWLNALTAESGSVPKTELNEKAHFVLSEAQLTVMMHLSTGNFDTEQDVLTALEQSALFDLDTDTARRAIEDLHECSFVSDFRLSDKGRDYLEKSPYGSYLHELEALKQ